MSVATKDGAWLSVSKVTRLSCTKCGTVLTTTHPTNDRQTDDLIRAHAQEKHGGIDRGY